MPLSTLDPTPALVVIDLQKAVTALEAAHPVAEVVGHAAELAAAFRFSRLPVVLVNATGRAPGRTQVQRAPATPAPDWADLVEELDEQPDDVRISKQTWGAFHRTDLDAQLRARGVTQVVIAGIATSMGVESTARAAYEHGYHVVLATDAMTDSTAEAHGHSVEWVFPLLGETATSEEIVLALEAR